ncbi:SIR2 family protein [Tardiphaga sp. 709]|uniref:SIR2 family protein n=1 Tax=Tardiphaga sp. 709 TaxID=3076039 RepID=UPI0028EF9611|nr:SIR2 family protein [Tardiphaga sp. 709]WNV10968.1 SIR2 family protein [Tardiphaga sp. 709]
MEQSEFTAIFSERSQNFAWFLGAGASRSAGVPTANDILWDMKRRFYCQQENQEILRQDLQSIAVKDRIQSYLESRGFPALWEDGEYERCFEQIFGSDKERQRRYIHAILGEENVSLSIGNRVLGALIGSGASRAVFTTNFDNVVERSVSEVSGKAIAAFHLEGSHNAQSALNNEEFPIYCKLHGDFRYDSLRNLPAELKKQDADLASCFTAAGNRFGLIVCGYSGRDQSVIDLINSVLETHNPFPHGLYWSVLKGSEPIPAVQKLLDRARARGVNADVIFIETYDAFMLRLWRNLPTKSQEMDLKVRRVASASVSIPLPKVGNRSPLVRLNALPIFEIPDRCHVLNISGFVSWESLRSARDRSLGRIILTKTDRVLCWGAEKDAKAAFGAKLIGLSPKEISAELNAPENLVIKGFVAEALCVALTRGKPLLARTVRSGSFAVADAQMDSPAVFEPLFRVIGKTSGIISGLMAPVDDDHPAAETVSWAEAARISIEIKDGRPWLVVEPDVWIWPTRARKLAVKFLDERRGDRYNNKFNSLLDAWVQVLLGTRERNQTVAIQAFAEGENAENPRFVIGTRTAFTRRASA